LSSMDIARFNLDRQRLSAAALVSRVCFFMCSPCQIARANGMPARETSINYLVLQKILRTRFGCVMCLRRRAFWHFEKNPIARFCKIARGKSRHHTGKKTAVSGLKAATICLFAIMAQFSLASR
jgi:hypothetical protein